MKYFKQLKLFIFVLILLMARVPIFSEDNDPRVGYIDIEYVIENSALKDTLYRDYTNQKERLKQIKIDAEKNLIALKKEMRINEELLSFSEYQEKEKELLQKKEELESGIKEVRDDIKKWEDDLMATLFDEVLIIMQMIAEEENLDIIISKNRSVLYGTEGLDFSQKAIDIINELNERDTPVAR